MTYTIAQISEKFGVAASTLRYYEDLGLLRNVERAEKRAARECYAPRSGYLDGIFRRGF